MKKSLIVFLAFILLASLVACGTSSKQGETTGGNTPSTTTPSAPPSGGTAIPPPKSSGSLTGPEGQEYGGLMRIGTTASLNDPFGCPWAFQSFNRPFVPFGEALMLETLYGEYSPNLAKSWTIDVDKPEVVFQLRDDVTYADGSKFNAEAVVWNIEKWMEGKIADSAIKGAEARGEYEVAVLLHSYSNSIISIMSSRVSCMVSKEFYEKNGEQIAAENAVGTGPFKLKERIPGVKVSFERRDDYWIDGQPYLDGIEYISMPDIMTQNAAVMSTGADAIDFLITTNAEQVAFLQESADVHVEMQSAGALCLMPSSRDEGSPLSIREVRQAISNAIDRQSISDARGFGIWEPGFQLIPPGFPGHLPDSYNLGYDPARAKELLIQAGYPDGFSMPFYGAPGTDQDAVVAIQSMLAEVGINAVLEFPESGAATALRYDGFDGIITYGIRPLANILQIWWYAFDADYFYYPTTWRPDDMVTAYLEARKAPQVELPRVEELHKMVLDNQLLVPVYYTNECYILKNNMHDTGHPIWGAGTQWLANTAWKSSR